MIDFLYTQKYDNGSTGSEPNGKSSLTDEINNVTTSNDLPDKADNHVAFEPSPAPTTETSSDADAATQELIRHVLVNSIADYYDIPALKDLANEKIRLVLDTSCTANGFSRVLKKVFECTSDEMLQKMMVLFAALNIEQLIELEDFTGPRYPERILYRRHEKYGLLHSRQRSMSVTRDSNWLSLISTGDSNLFSLS
jgi:hypothetical protein